MSQRALPSCKIAPQVLQLLASYGGILAQCAHTVLLLGHSSQQKLQNSPPSKMPQNLAPKVRLSLLARARGGGDSSVLDANYPPN